MTTRPDIKALKEALKRWRRERTPENAEAVEKALLDYADIERWLRKHNGITRPTLI